MISFKSINSIHEIDFFQNQINDFQKKKINYCLSKKNINLFFFKNNLFLGLFFFEKKKSFFLNDLIIDNRKSSLFILNKNLKDDEIDSIFELIIKNLKKKYDRLFFNFYSDDNKYLARKFKESNCKISKLNQDYILNINNEDDVLLKFSNEKRRDIFKSFKNNLHFKITEKNFFLDSIKKLDLEKNHYLYSHGCFFDFILTLDQVYKLVVVYEDKVIAAALILENFETFYYYFSAIDRKFASLKSMDFLIFSFLMHMIKIKKNIKFNFMETSLKKKSGVGKFKMQWGGDTLINFGYRYNLSLISKILGFFGK